MAHLNATPKQLALIARGKITLCEVLRKQPPEAVTTYMVDKPDVITDSLLGNNYCIKNKVLFISCDSNGKRSHIYIPLRYPVGKEIGVKQEWAKSFDYITNKWIYVYMEDFPKRIKESYTSATMPAEAIRTKLKVVGSSVKQVQDVTLEEMKSIGISYYIPAITFSAMKEALDDTKEIMSKLILSSTKDLFKHWFNSKYANKRRKNKVTWEDNPYCELVECEVE